MIQAKIGDFQVDVETTKNCDNRYNDGRNFIYFEIRESNLPKELEEQCNHYHTWTLQSGEKLKGLFYQTN